MLTDEQARDIAAAPAMAMATPVPLELRELLGSHARMVAKIATWVAFQFDLPSDERTAFMLELTKAHQTLISATLALYPAPPVEGSAS